MLPVYNNALQSQYDGFMASRQIDKVTHNLALKRWNTLEDDMKELVSKACEIQAVFLFENKAKLNSPVKSVTIGSISMTNDFDNPNAFHVEDGVIMPISAYSLLQDAGLTTRLL